jgi:hypothetical protein
MHLEKDRFVDKIISGSKTVLPSFFVTYIVIYQTKMK